MLRKRRKAAPVVSAAVDRRLADVDKPFNGKLAIRVVDDPYQPGYKVAVSASLRDDPLGRLHARRQVTESQYAAGHYLQAMFELAEIGSVQAMDPGKPAVDGRGQYVEPITDKQRRAVKRLTEARQALGKRGYELAFQVLGSRMFIEQCAIVRGLRGKHAAEYLGKRFRECLDTIAETFGFSGQAPAARQVRDQHSDNARFAQLPELHRAVRRAREEV